MLPMTQDPSRSSTIPPLTSITTPVRSPSVALASEQNDIAEVAQASNADLQWRIDFAWKINDQNQELIRSTDQKTYNLIVMSTLLISLSSANVERFVVRPAAREIALAVLVVTCVNFFVHALSTLFARAGTTTTPSKSMIFFGHIVSHGPGSGYQDQFSAASKSELLEDLVTQVSVVSLILQKKMASYRRSWMAAALEVCAFLLMVLFGRFL